eukprot:COSAG05_NODE_533_length_8896_cov_17.527404_5_plen_1339_part_00
MQHMRAGAELLRPTTTSMFQLAATCVVGLLLACAPAIVAPFETRDNNAAYSSNRGMSVYIGPAPCDVLLDAARTWLAAHHPPVGDSSTDSLPEVGECRAADPGTGHVGEANGDAIPVPGDAATHTIIEKAGQGIAATQPGSPADAATTRGGPKVRAGATTTRPKTQHDTHHGYTSAGRRDGVVRDGRHHSSPAIANTVGSEPSHGVDNHTAQEPGAVRDRNVVVDDEGGMSEAAILSPAPPPVAIRRAHFGMPKVSTNVRKSPHNVRPPATDVHLSHNASRREEPRNDASWDSRRIVDARDDFDGTSVSNMVEQDANTRDTASNEHDVRAIAAPSPTATSKASSSDLFLSQRFPQRSAGSRAVPEERGRSDTPETAASFQQATTAGSRQTPTSTQASEPSALQETRATTSLRRALQSAQVGAVTTLAGQSQQGVKDATGASAQFYNPFGVAIDPTGKYALVTDYSNHRIRRLDLGTKAVTTLAGQSQYGVKDATGASAQFYYPYDVAIDPTGKYALVADASNHRIRRLDLGTKAVTTLAGQSQSGFKDATGASAQFYFPYGVAIDPAGKYALVADRSNHRIRRLDLGTKAVTTLAGQSQNGFKDATGASAQFNNPRGVAIDPTGKYALVADEYSHRIRRLDLGTKAVTTLAGQSQSGFKDATGASAQFYYPYDVAIDPTGKYALVADANNHRIRRLDLGTKAVTTLAGQSQYGVKDATGASAQFYFPYGVAIDPTGKYALVADAYNHRIRKVIVCTSTCAGKTCKCDRGTPVKNETLCKDGPSLCAACDPGHTLNASNTGCVACAVGRFLLRGSNECKDCAAGSVAPSAGSANCSVCASGKHVVNTTAPCANCPAGRFVAKSGQLNCSACPRGKGPTSARTACQDCQGIQFSTCGICKDCKAPNIRIDAILCVAPNTACQPGSAPLNDSESGGASARNNSCGTVERCKRCPPGKVSADGGTCLACSEGNRVANQEQVACEGCGPGTAPSPDRSRCVGCIGTNFSSFGVQCNPCDRRFILDRNRTSCTACAAGKGPTTHQTSCVACRPGKFSSAGVCETCVPGPAGQTIAAFAGSVVCLNCPAGKVAHNNATECRCAAGTYNISAMVVRCFSAEYFPREVTVIRPEDRSECQPCPACLDCNSIGSPVTKSGYRLRKSNDHVTVHVEVGLNVTALIKPRQLSEHHAFTCPHASSCLSGPVRGNETLDCLIGHTGVLCQGCESGWSKTPSGSCFECQGGNDGQWALLAVLVVVVLVAMYFGLSVYMKRKRQKQEQQGGSAGLLFDCLDTDRSGNITRAELRTGLAELGMTLSESETFALMETIDMDGSGDVDRDEFGSCPD